MNGNNQISIFYDNRRSGLPERVFRRYLQGTLEEVFPAGVPQGLIDLLSAEPGIRKTRDEIGVIVYKLIQEGGSFPNVTGLPNRGPSQWSRMLSDIYNGANLGTSKPLISDKIFGSELPSQEGFIAVYDLPSDLKSLLTHFSSQIQSAYQEWKESNPDAPIDFVPYNQDNLHASLVQGEFVNSGDTLDANEFANKVRSGKYNPVGVKYSGIGLPRDAVVVKYIPESPLAHVANQILVSHRTVTGMSSLLNKQGWGMHITVGRFVGEGSDSRLTHTIDTLVAELDGKLRAMGDQVFDTIESRVLQHFFSRQGGSFFRLRRP